MQWEYMWFSYAVRDLDKAGETLDGLGARGWELVSVVYFDNESTMFYLKRRKSN